MDSARIEKIATLFRSPSLPNTVRFFPVAVRGAVTRDPDAMLFSSWASHDGRVQGELRGISGRRVRRGRRHRLSNLRNGAGGTGEIGVPVGVGRDVRILSHRDLALAMALDG